MTTALIIHKVADYDAWRPGYDAFDETRQAMGVRYAEVLRSADDPQLVIVRHDFDDRAAAHEFLGADDLRQAMSEAGVDPSSVQIHIAEPA